MRKWYNKLFLNDIRNAVKDFDLIENEDNILVGMSGGKDSIFLLYALDLLRKNSYLKFNLIACHIDIGLNLDISDIEEFCKDRNIPFIVESIDFKEKIESSRKSPCFICSKYKRGTMARISKDFNCNKIAYGHHLTDLVNTLILNTIYQGKFDVFKAHSFNDKHDSSLIRPLIYIKESTIKKVVEDENLPLAHGELCKFDKTNERNNINKIIEFSENLYPNYQKMLLKSIKNSDLI